MSNPKNICVYCSASDLVDKMFFEEANKLATLIAQHNHTLVYGGGCVGLMGEVARTVQHHNGKVIGVIPEGLIKKEVGYDNADELIITKTMRERKGIMDDRSDAFVTLPGGFGTLEEISEMLTSKQLQFHDKPLVIVNTGGFYNPLLHFFEHMYNFNFASPEFKKAYYIADSAEDAIKYIEEYVPEEIASKFSAQ